MGNQYLEDTRKIRSQSLRRLLELYAELGPDIKTTDRKKMVFQIMEKLDISKPAAYDYAYTLRNLDPPKEAITAPQPKKEPNILDLLPKDMSLSPDSKKLFDTAFPYFVMMLNLATSKEAGPHYRRTEIMKKMDELVNMILVDKEIEDYLENYTLTGQPIHRVVGHVKEGADRTDVKNIRIMSTSIDPPILKILDNYGAYMLGSMRPNIESELSAKVLKQYHREMRIFVYYPQIITESDLELYIVARTVLYHCLKHLCPARAEDSRRKFWFDDSDLIVVEEVVDQWNLHPKMIDC